MAEQNRTPRELESREKQPARAVYVPPSTLPDPTPVPGFGFRWIATHVMGKSDPSNVSKRLRDGWVPVKAADHPELQLFGNTAGNVEIGGLMLCKAPIELLQSRDQYYADMAQGQMESVDNSYMSDNDPRMAKFRDNKSSTSRGRGFGTGT